LTVVKTGDQVDTLRVAVQRSGKHACRNERQASCCAHDVANWFNVFRAYVLEGLEGFVASTRSSSSLRLREDEQNGEPEILTMDKSGANLAALEALSGQDISTVEKMAFQKVRLSPIYEHCSNDRSWPAVPAETRRHKAAAGLCEFFRLASYGRPGRTNTVGHIGSFSCSAVQSRECRVRSGSRHRERSA
jgi:hypothetical protein